MPKRAAIVPNRVIHTTFPPELMTKLELLLWSEAEGRIPKGDLQSFLVARIQEYFSNRSLDLAPYLGSLPGEHMVQANDHTLSRLITHLQGGSSHGNATPAVPHP